MTWSATAPSSPRPSPSASLAQVSDLAISLFATSPNSEYADARQRTLLDRIKAYMDIQSRDPALTPDQIAAAANISTRYLHKLFEGEHTAARRPRRVKRPPLEPQGMTVRFEVRLLAAE